MNKLQTGQWTYGETKTGRYAEYKVIYEGMYDFVIRLDYNALEYILEVKYCFADGRPDNEMFRVDSDSNFIYPENMLNFLVTKYQLPEPKLD